MKAALLSQFGGPEALIVTTVETPRPGPGEVLVRVEAAGINFTDTAQRAGSLGPMPLPLVMGGEVAGTVEALGADVQGVAKGARVAVPLFAHGRMGGYAEYVLAPAAALVPLPDDLAAADAVALMVQGMTALHLSRRFAMRGKRVFIHAAGGGVGSLLVQLARQQGASEILAGASGAAKLDGLGADVTRIDYGQGGWTDAIKDKVDLIFDSAGGAVTAASLSLLAPGGTLVLYGLPSLSGFAITGAETMGLVMANQTVSGFSIMPEISPAAVAAALADLVALGVRSRLATYRLDDAAKAHADMEARRTRGKVVLLP
ncbi:MAG: zinc-binding dehydrogenase [Alphaproteobacteria bacterium]|nr:zinc-binding dehydrogenase [Alphaproteobacteria bacterium]